MLGLCCYAQTFSSCSSRGLLSSCGALASPCGGFLLRWFLLLQSMDPRACRLQWLQHMGLAAQRHVGSFQLYFWLGLFPFNVFFLLLGIAFPEYRQFKVIYCSIYISFWSRCSGHGPKWGNTCSTPFLPPPRRPWCRAPGARR